jgi:tetratricopeptide (TPR) repeat protein
MLNLDKGINRKKLGLCFPKKDVRDEEAGDIELTRGDILEIVWVNGFRTEGGLALFHEPSYINHSCMPNTLNHRIKDMIFIRSSVSIPAGAEIFTQYALIQYAESFEDREKVLRARQVPFECACGLCLFESTNIAIIKPAVETVQRMDRKYADCQPESRGAIDELTNARSNLYRLFQVPMPEPQLTEIRTFSVQAPRDFAFARLLQRILFDLRRALNQAGRYEEAAHCYAESFAITKGNPVLSCDRPLETACPALYVWGYLIDTLQHPKSSPIALAWFKEAESICSLVLGRGTHLESIEINAEIIARVNKR